MIVGMVFGSTGWAPWVPWSIVPLFAGVAGPEAQQSIGAGSYAVLAGVFVVGLAITMIHINKADNTQ